MKPITLITLCLLFSVELFSQQTKIGVFVEPQVSWLVPDSRNTTRNGTAIGVDGGLILDKFFQKNYAFQSGIGLGVNGGGIQLGEPVIITAYNEDDTLVTGTNLDLQINSISVPIGLKLKTNPIGYFSYYARVGFMNRFNIKVKGTSSDGILDKATITDQVFFYNLAYYFGIGAQYDITKDTAFLFSVNYSNGFINQFFSKKDIKTYSRAVTLRLGVLF